MHRITVLLFLMVVGCNYLLCISDRISSSSLAREEPSRVEDEFGSTGLNKTEFEYWKARADSSIGSVERRKELAVELEQKYPGGSGPEVIRMLHSIASDVAIGPTDGWFGPGQGLYDWTWLKERHDIRDGDSIELAKFKGRKQHFDRLDRDGNGRIQLLIWIGAKARNGLRKQQL